MPKLDTTIDNLERKTNKVTGTVPSASWTDTQYPSAKTLYNSYNSLLNMLNLVHPIGSILTTSTSTNPAASVGGTWELIDKGFKDTYITLDETYWTHTSADIGEYSNILLNDHTISMRLNLKNTVALTDSSIALGKLALTSCGVNSLSYALFYGVAIADNGNSTVAYRIDQDGRISTQDVLNIDDTHNLPVGSNFYLLVTQAVRHTNMLDEFCDKFYWKRTA